MEKYRDPCVYDDFESASALELSPEILTLTPGTPYIYTYLYIVINDMEKYRDPCVYDVFDSASALELSPEILTLTPGTSCTYIYLYIVINDMEKYRDTKQRKFLTFTRGL